LSLRPRSGWRRPQPISQDKARHPSIAATGVKKRVWTLQARQQGRIGQVAIDPILPVKAFMDIGGAGHSSDAMAIWICQFVGREIRLLDYIEGVGQPLAYYAGELRRRGWKEAVICLPHDGVAHNNITGKRYIDHWREAGFECETPIKNTSRLRRLLVSPASPHGSIVG
jgi:hypothetical protein